MEQIIMLNAKELRELIREEVEAAVSKIEARDHLPPVLTKKQVMEVLNISHYTATELLGRADFPAIREAGHVKVRKERLFEWLDAHTQTSQKSSTLIRSVI